MSLNLQTVVRLTILLTIITAGVVGDLNEGEQVAVHILWPTAERAQHILSGLPVSLRVDAFGALHMSGNYHFVAILDGTPVAHARARPDLDSGGASRRCGAQLTLKPLKPGSHELIVALHHSDGTLFDAFVAVSNLAMTVLAGNTASEAVPETVAGGKPQFVPRDELETLAWRAAGFYANTTKDTADLAGVVVVVVANYGYRHMLANWMCHSDRLGLRYLVGIVDEGLKHWMDRHYPHVPTHLLFEPSAGSSMQDDTSYMALDMMRVVWACHELVLRLLDRGLSVLYTDADVVFLRDPVASVLHSCDFSYQVCMWKLMCVRVCTRARGACGVHSRVH